MIKVGDEVGRWLVASEAEPYVLPSGKKRRRVVAQCSCGAVSVVHVSNLRDGKSLSCGCLRQELSVEKTRTHGMSGTKIYKVWASMIQRCTNQNYPKWKDYGGRGIKVCEEWKSFETFFEDMGFPPEGMTLERKKNEDGYSASNCTWATSSQQGNNRRSTVVLSFDGVAKPLSEWAKELGIKRHTLANRIRLGWPIERALTSTVRPH